jgi:pimeloyl-ACP methyl ester carboxylesterase
LSDPKDRTPVVILIPGGGSSVHGYFPELEQRLGDRARLIELDPPGLDEATGRRWMRLRDHATVLARAIDASGRAPVVAVGHSLGGLVALRLALDHGEKLDGLVLLDPSPLMPAMLLPQPLLKALGALRKVFRDVLLRPTPLANREPPKPRELPLLKRLLWYLVIDGGALAADVSRTGLRGLPTIVVSAGEHAPKSATRRTHERLAAFVPGAALEIWPDTTHGVPTERPAEVAETIAILLDRVAPKDSPETA